MRLLALIAAVAIVCLNSACRSERSENALTLPDARLDLHLSGPGVIVHPKDPNFVEISRRMGVGYRTSNGACTISMSSGMIHPGERPWAGEEVEFDPINCRALFAIGYFRTIPPASPGARIDTAATVSDSTH